MSTGQVKERLIAVLQEVVETHQAGDSECRLQIAWRGFQFFFFRKIRSAMRVCSSETQGSGVRRDGQTFHEPPQRGLQALLALRNVALQKGVKTAARTLGGWWFGVIQLKFEDAFKLKESDVCKFVFVMPSVQQKVSFKTISNGTTSAMALRLGRSSVLRVKSALRGSDNEI